MIHQVRFSGLRAGSLAHALVAALLIFVLASLLLLQMQADQKKSDKIAQKPAADSPALIPVPADRILPADDDRVDDCGDALPASAMRRLGSVRLRHGAAVTSLFFASDSRTLLTCGEDKTISWWDVAEGKELRRILSEQGTGMVVPLSDGESFVSTDRYNPVFNVRRISDGKVFQRLIGNARLSDILFASSPDQRWYAAPASGSVIQIWDAVAVKPHGRLGDPADPARFISFAADSSLIIFTDSGKCQHWDVESRQKISESNIGAFKSVAAAADGKSFVAVSSGKAVILKNDGPPVVEQFLISPECIALSSDGAKIAYKIRREVRVWDFMTGSVSFSTESGVQNVHSLGFSPDGRYLAAGFGSGLVRIWDQTAEHETGKSDGHEGAVKSLAFTNDGTGLVSLGADGELLQWDLLDGKMVSSHLVASHPIILKVLDEDRVLLFSTGRLTVWSLKNKSVLAQAGSGQFLAGYPLSTVAVSRNGRRAVITERSVSGNDASQARNVLRVWDIDQMKLIAEFPSPERLAGLALSPDGSGLAVTTVPLPPGSAGQGQTLYFYDVDAGLERFNMPIPTRMGYTSIPMFSPQGSLTVSGGSYENGGNVLKIASSGEKIYFVSCQGKFIGQDQYSPDGKLIVRPAWNDGASLQIGPVYGPCRTLKGHRGQVGAVAFSPGGRYLATGGRDSTILLWDLNAGESFLESDERAPLNVEMLPEAPLNAPPYLTLSFEGSIGTYPLAVTCLADNLPGRTFVPGANGLALSLSAAEHYPVVLQEGEDIVLPPCWTVQFWFMIDHRPGEESMGYMEVFDCDLLSFVINKEGRATLFYRFPNRGGHGSVSLLKAQQLAYGRWYNLAVAWEGPKGNLRVYLDGIQIWDSPQAGLGSVVGPMSFGRGGGRSPANRVVIDELKIFKHARRPEELAQETGFAEDPHQ